MLILFILGLLLGAVAVMFSLQNIAVVTVSFFNWQLQGSLAIILLLAIGAGVLVCLLLILPGTIQTSVRLRSLSRENTKLIEELRKHKELTTFAKQENPTKQTIDEIENGAIENPNS